MPPRAIAQPPGGARPSAMRIAAQETEEEAGVVVEVGGEPEPHRQPHDGIDRPEKPVEKEVADAQEELGALSLGVGVAPPAQERVDGHRSERGGEHRDQRRSCPSAVSGDGGIGAPTGEEDPEDADGDAPAGGDRRCRRRGPAPWPRRTPGGRGSRPPRVVPMLPGGAKGTASARLTARSTRKAAAKRQMETHGPHGEADDADLERPGADGGGGRQTQGLGTPRRVQSLRAPGPGSRRASREASGSGHRRGGSWSAARRRRRPRRENRASVAKAPGTYPQGHVHEERQQDQPEQEPRRVHEMVEHDRAQDGRGGQSRAPAQRLHSGQLTGSRREHGREGEAEDHRLEGRSEASRRRVKGRTRASQRRGLKGHGPEVDQDGDRDPPGLAVARVAPRGGPRTSWNVQTLAARSAASGAPAQRPWPAGPVGPGRRLGSLGPPSRRRGPGASASGQGRARSRLGEGQGSRRQRGFVGPGDETRDVDRLVEGLAARVVRPDALRELAEERRVPLGVAGPAAHPAAEIDVLADVGDDPLLPGRRPRARRALPRSGSGSRAAAAQVRLNCARHSP